ncbi:GNAT family N-acetyltransferase [Tritonibacter mobilis]|uniref:Acetyltransferase n=1 Tax=Tritonibacter mobilis F1926 TaxID=1265309 RepID=A0A1B0ZZM3_9RHOB|nr:GNAT family N-acetyltransferase [Tritonibacter mobilis]ANP39795.1 acetyltransferase [Tritonibacter mobilis F1926]KJZ23966.1 acetyltransferase [Tritonibacter mobilis]
MIEIVSAESCDAAKISTVLEGLRKVGKRRKPGDAIFAQTHYIAHPDRLSCLIAMDVRGDVLGFQSLKIAVDGNAYGTPVGWGIIGTHVLPQASGRGIGRALFVETKKAALKMCLPAIEALIGADNAQGLGYYSAMGFVDYRETPTAVGKKLVLTT